MRVIIIRASHGGIAVTARLAKAGYQVMVLEKQPYAGGRLALFQSMRPLLQAPT
ncbi:MAG: NAD(P)-binding protein [Anaerolineae bacterium]